MAYQNTAQNICNMIKCKRNTHPLFRTYGLGSEVDGLNGLTRSNLTVEMKKWYPSTQLKTIKVVQADASGEFEYNIQITEV